MSKTGYRVNWTGYKLLMGHTTDELNDRVDAHLKDGWKLSGVHQCSMACQAISDHPCSGQMYYCFTQAVTK